DDHPGPDDREPRLLQVRLGRQRRRRLHRRARHQRRRRAQHLGAQVRAAVDARPAAQGPQAVLEEAHADLGLGPVGHRLRQHQVLRAVHGEAGHQLGGPARGHQEHLRQARH
ncbi:MAG: Iron-sulfur cluster assembly protein SufB, partial [uncultured Frankineae bacterium]